MFEDSFLDSFMESHIGGWTADTESMYDNEADENWWADREEDDSDEYDDDDEYYDEQDEHLENADLDFDQSDY
jgi:hypothetical protein